MAKSSQEVLQLFQNKWQLKYNDFIYDMTDYKNMGQKISIHHIPCGNHYLQTPTAHLQAKVGCLYCIPHKKSSEQILLLFHEKWGDEFDYSHSKINGIKNNIDILHRKCGTIFSQSPRLHLKLVYACAVCAYSHNGSYRAYTVESFRQKLIDTRGQNIMIIMIVFMLMRILKLIFIIKFVNNIFYKILIVI